jgi:nucleoside-diphosphate-sugar epimerase
MTILVTGANGFVGSALCACLGKNGASVRAAVRALNSYSGGIEAVEVGSLSSETDWTVPLSSINQVVHLAARVHVMNDKSADPLEDFRKINVDATINLAKQAAAAGVKRFIYLSSIKVNGESTQLGRPFTAEDVARPQDPYAVSKYESERELRKIAEQTGMEVVIIRPPLVYGPDVKANFASMMGIIQRGLPLPLASVTDNQRSLVALGNVIDLIVTCINHPAARSLQNAISLKQIG